jgi:hypothetical protein
MWGKKKGIIGYQTEHIGIPKYLVLSCEKFNLQNIKGRSPAFIHN